MQDPNNPYNNYGRADNPGGQPSDQQPTQGYNQPDGYTPPPAGGYPPSGAYQQPPAGGYPPSGAYQQPPAGGYPPPGAYQQPPAGGYQQPPYQQPGYPPYQSGGPFAPPPGQQSTTVVTQKRGGNGALYGLLGLLVLVVLGVGAYFLFFNKSSTNTTAGNATATPLASAGGSSSPTAVRGNTANPSPTTGSSNSGDSGGGSGNVGLLKQGAQSMKAAKSYSIALDGTAGGQAIKMNGDIDVANNKTKLTIEVQGLNIDLISIGNDAYVSSDGGKNFADMGSSGSFTSGFSSFTSMWNNFNASDIDKASSALKDAGSANIDGTDCKQISAAAKDLGGLSGSMSGGTSVEGNIDIWVASNGSRICQMKVKGTTAGSDADITIKWSKLNESFDIQKPANVGSGTGGLGSGGLGGDEATPTTESGLGGTIGGLGGDETPTADTGSTGSSGDSGKIDLAGLDNVKSYHLVLTTGGSGTQTTIEGDFIRPDKAKMNIQTGSTSVEYIIIGADSWTGVSGTYYKSPSGGTSMIDSYTSILKSTTDSLQGYTGYKEVGSETIEGVDTTRYQYSAAGTTADVWVAKSDKIMRKAVYKGAGYDVTFTVSKINEVADITPPPGQ